METIHDLRANRATVAAAACTRDLGAVVLPGDGVSTVCRALLTTLRMLEAERVTADARAGMANAPSRLERDVRAAHDAVVAASRAMP